MGSINYIEGSPPKELFDSLEQMLEFPSQRTAKVFWEAGEKIFREERLWPIPFSKKIAEILYLGEKDYTLDYCKAGFFVDYMTFSPASSKEENYFAVSRDRAENILKMGISGILIGKNEEIIKEYRFKL